MQRACWRRRCLQPSQVQDLLNRSQKVALPGSQRFASQQPSPGFSASKPPSTKPRPFKEKPLPSDGNKSSAQQHDPTNQSNPKETSNSQARKRFPKPSGRVIIYSIIVLLGLKLYTWRTNLRRSLMFTPRFFTPFIFEKRDQVSSTSFILNVKSVPAGQNTDNVTEAWKTGVWSVLVAQPELQVARPYTPLPPREGDEPEQIRLFVRQEPNGEVSTFLHKIYRGTIVNLRGPRIEYEIPTDIDEVLFVAGGTGIAPALQVAHTLFKYRSSSTEDTPKLRILWANRRREDSYKRAVSTSSQPPQETATSRLGDIAATWMGKPGTRPQKTQDKESADPPQPQTPLVEELEALKIRNPGKVEIDYFVDEENSYITESVLRQFLSSAEQRSDHLSEDQPARKRVVLISGSEGFVSYYAGPKFMIGRQEIQGPLAGLLQKINLKGWEVWKL